MPKKDKTGPPRKSTGPKDGRGEGKGRYGGKGIGTKKRGKGGVKNKEKL